MVREIEAVVNCTVAIQKTHLLLDSFLLSRLTLQGQTSVAHLDPRAAFALPISAAVNTRLDCRVLTALWGGWEVDESVWLAHRHESTCAFGIH